MGNPHGEDGKTVEQIPAEAPVPRSDLELIVAGGDDPHVRRQIAVSTHPAILTLLDEAQQFGLKAQVHDGDLVEKKGPGVRLGNEPGPVLVRVGECAALVPEELALRQLRRNRRTVDRDERTMPSGAVLVQQASEHLLAGTRFTFDQHVDVVPGGQEELLACPEERRRVTQQLMVTDSRVCSLLAHFFPPPASWHLNIDTCRRKLSGVVRKPRTTLAEPVIQEPRGRGEIVI
ncbi:MAG: hypothetical protein WAM82_20700 [Thermoanaerobaculia bacterium]